MYLWCIDIHLVVIFFMLLMCCDLLSKCIFDVLIFTLQLLVPIPVFVVICFQNVSLMYWYSLNEPILIAHLVLWFALFICVLFLKVFMLLRSAPWSPRSSIDTIKKTINSSIKCIFDVLIFTAVNVSTL